MESNSPADADTNFVQLSDNFQITSQALRGGHVREQHLGPYAGHYEKALVAEGLGATA